MSRLGSTGALLLALATSSASAQYAAVVLADAPLHYFRIEETIGQPGAADQGAPGGIVGLFNGGITLNQPSLAAATQRCARFDGNAGTFIDLGLFHPGGALTVEAWVNLDSDARAGSYHAIVARWDGSYELDLATDDRANFVVRNQANALGVAVSAAPVPRGQWQHLVGTFTNGVARVYVNGVAGAPVNIGGTLRDGGPTPDRVLIGSTRDGFGGSFNWKGLLDEVAIYNYALGTNRILAHHDAAVSGAVRVDIEPAAFITWPAFPPGLTLQTADPGQPISPWTDVLLPRALDSGFYKVVVPAAETNKLYRLFKP